MSSKELQNLLHMEAAVIQAVQYAQYTLAEMAKDTQVDAQRVRSDAHNFMKSVQVLHEKLLHTIKYLGAVSTSVPHSGSVYNAEKDFQLAHEQCTLLFGRLATLGELSTERDYKPVVAAECLDGQWNLEPLNPGPPIKI